MLLWLGPLAIPASHGTQMEEWSVVRKQSTVPGPFLAPCITGHGDPTQRSAQILGKIPVPFPRGCQLGREVELKARRKEQALTGTEDPECQGVWGWQAAARGPALLLSP